jgi:hypothetical protein
VREFGGHVAVGVVGFGGFGTVFRGHRVGKGGRRDVVAIKAAHPSDRARRALANEVAAMHRVAGVPGVPRLRACVIRVFLRAEPVKHEVDH